MPGALLMIMTGLRLGMGAALILIVAAEFVGAKNGDRVLPWKARSGSEGLKR